MKKAAYDSILQSLKELRPQAIKLEREVIGIAAVPGHVGRTSHQSTGITKARVIHRGDRVLIVKTPKTDRLRKAP